MPTIRRISSIHQHELRLPHACGCLWVFFFSISHRSRISMMGTKKIDLGPKIEHLGSVKKKSGRQRGSQMYGTLPEPRSFPQRNIVECQPPVIKRRLFDATSIPYPVVVVGWWRACVVRLSWRYCFPSSARWRCRLLGSRPASYRNVFGQQRFAGFPRHDYTSCAFFANDDFSLGLTAAVGMASAHSSGVVRSGLCRW